MGKRYDALVRFATDEDGKVNENIITLASEYKAAEVMAEYAARRSGGARAIEFSEYSDKDIALVNDFWHGLFSRAFK